MKELHPQKRLRGRIGGVPKEDFNFTDDDWDKHSFVITNDDKRIVNNTGVALIGQMLRKTHLDGDLKKLDKPKNLKHSNYDCIAGYVGLLAQGKTAYEALKEMHKDPSFYSRALKINSIPSVETLRQRLDMLGPYLADSNLIQEVNERLLATVGAKFSLTFSPHIPLDIDVSIHDNSDTKKEGVERTYAGIDGYAPIYAYLGMEGFIVNTELRPGKDHSQCAKTVPFLKASIAASRRLVKENILVRMDAGNDAKDNIVVCVTENVDYLIKRNLRNESLEGWLATAKETASLVVTPREGKIEYTGSIWRDIGLEKPVRIVYQVIERSIDRHGQIFLAPKIEANTWWTSLDDMEEYDVIALYHEHALCEQFHSEIKSDIGLERFPSGYFATNATILKLAMLAYNMLRLLGQATMGTAGKALNRGDIMRLRVKTVIQRLVYMAAHVTQHARRTYLSLGRSNLWRWVWCNLYTAMA